LPDISPAAFAISVFAISMILIITCQPAFLQPAAIAASLSLRQLRYDCHYAIFAFHYAAIIFHYFLSRLFSFDIAIVIDYY
jgi:hypothetical protein